MSHFLNFSRLTEGDFDNIVINRLGGKRYTDDPNVSEKNCDYKIDNILIELKIIEEEPLEIKSKQANLAALFRSDIKTVILNPFDLNDNDKRKYYKILYTPIQNALKKASTQLKDSATNAEYKVAIIVNNGLSMTDPEEFFTLSYVRAKNDTSNIDTLIVCGVYHYSDSFDTIATIFYKEMEIQAKYRPVQFLCDFEIAWNQEVKKYMTEQLINCDIQRNKAPISDISFEKNGIRYIKPAKRWGNDSSFFGITGRPRNDTTCIDVCPSVGIVIPNFEYESYYYARENIVSSDVYLLKNSLNEYQIWLEEEKMANSDIQKPLVPIIVTLDDLKDLKGKFTFSTLSDLGLAKFSAKLNEIIENSRDFKTILDCEDYILLQVNEIGMDKANDIAFISYNTVNQSKDLQTIILFGERLKFDHAIVLASSYCILHNSANLYYHRNEDFKWK